MACIRDQIELLFYDDPDVCDMRQIVSRPCADLRQGAPPSRAKAVSGVPAIPTAAEPEFRIAAPREAEDLPFVREDLRG